MAAARVALGAGVSDVVWGADEHRPRVLGGVANRADATGPAVGARDRPEHDRDAAGRGHARDRASAGGPHAALSSARPWLHRRRTSRTRSASPENLAAAAIRARLAAATPDPRVAAASAGPGACDRD